MHRIAIVAFVALLGAGRAAAQCGPKGLDFPRQRDSLLVSVAWLASHLNDPGIVILHADHDRTAYDAGHVPGARFIPMDNFAAGDMDLPSADRLEAVFERLGISNGTRVIMYGETWHLGRLFLALDYMGHGDRSAVLDGGIAEWRAQKKPVSKDAPAPAARADYVPRVRADLVVDADWVNAHLKDRRVKIIDGRTQEEYDGRGDKNYPRRGHVPGAMLLPWAETYQRPGDALEGGQSPLVTLAQLRRLFGAAGVEAGIEPVFYCTIGLRASHLYFVARFLGFTPRIYDGSMSEWYRRPSLPIVTGPNPGGTR